MLLRSGLGPEFPFRIQPATKNPDDFDDRLDHPVIDGRGVRKVCFSSLAPTARAVSRGAGSRRASGRRGECAGHTHPPARRRPGRRRIGRFRTDRPPPPTGGGLQRPRFALYSAIRASTRAKASSIGIEGRGSSSASRIFSRT